MSSEITKTGTEILPIDYEKLSQFLDVMGLGTKLNENEKKQFFEISKAFGLNPFKREIYCNKYNEQLSIIVGYEVYIKRAERSGQLDGWQVITEGKVEDKSLKAIITIHRKDRKHPFVHEVYYNEYVQMTYDKETKQRRPNKFWAEKPITMIKKVATAQGFRQCFSDELGGMPYAPEEIDATYELVPDDKNTDPIPESKSQKTEPIPDGKKAVNDDITTEQVTQINLLLKEEVITDKERKKIGTEMTGYTSKRASDCINWLTTEIKNRTEVLKQQQNESTKS